MSEAFVQSSLSLADVAYQHVVDKYVVFRDVDPQRASILHPWLKEGFGHVEVWQYVPPGAWLRYDTATELITTEVFAHPPWELILPHWNPTFMRVRRCVNHGWFRERFFLGPITCVELAKAFIGVSAFFVRTPYQLYKHLMRERQ